MIAALILAGGQGIRMGGADKAFVQLAGQSLLSHLRARLAPQVETVAISANGDPTRFAAHALPVLQDAPAHSGKGPLAGVAAGLAWAQSIGARGLLTIPVDTPFIPGDLLARLTPAPSVAVWRGRQHHLVATWLPAFLPALTDFLTEPGPHKVRDALAAAAARPVPFTSPADPFLNINTQQDLAAAEQNFFSQPMTRKPSPNPDHPGHPPARLVKTIPKP
jgi:molybdopterin-guanine dinucleotide biosynthesis protein A